MQLKLTGAPGYFVVLRDLVKSSGLYALSSIGAPLVSLLLAPFLTHHLSLTDYGILAVLVTLISLGSGITQLGLSAAFFRAYSYDYTSKGDRRSVLATIYFLLFLSSILLLLVAFFVAPSLTFLFTNQVSLESLILTVVVVILLQNLTVPVFALLRAENRALLFTIISMGSLLINAIVTIVCIGILHFGVVGALLGTGSGFAFVIISTAPIIIQSINFRIRYDIARDLLAFGLPLVPSIFSSWVLQLSDRFLLSRIGTLSETASYAVAYNLGSILSTLVVSPFILAWPATMYSIAKQSDAAQAFSFVFRWFGFLLLFAAFALSLVATIVLYWLFPPSYHGSAPIIPLVSESMVFGGIYYVLMVGANITRKTWLATVLTAVAAIANFVLNLFLIPKYGATGAAVSTLIAYIVLALLAYVVNQRIYPVPFEVGRFSLAFLIGMAVYFGCFMLANSMHMTWIWSVSVGIVSSIVYGLLLISIGRSGTLVDYKNASHVFVSWLTKRITRI
jgi:O-antigen/teichoic acid export membrane protein